MPTTTTEPPIPNTQTLKQKLKLLNNQTIREQIKQYFLTKIHNIAYVTLNPGENRYFDNVNNLVAYKAYKEGGGSSIIRLNTALKKLIENTTNSEAKQRSRNKKQVAKYRLTKSYLVR